MKIKTICDLTGLTDRTVRYYIEEELISPAYTENYLGRKSFDFSQEDLDSLKNITVLRRFDFTIAEIRQIILDENESRRIISNVRQRTEATVSAGKEKLQVLTLLKEEQTYTLDQLAQELSKPPIPIPAHQEIIKLDPVKTIVSFVKSLMVFGIVWAPIVLSLFVIIVDINYHHYPVFNYTLLGWTIASLWPSIAILIYSKTQWKWISARKRCLLIFCILGIPINVALSFGIVARSETADIRNYRDLDADCNANRQSFYQDLFPTWPHYFVNEKQPDGSWETVYLDARYYYCRRPAVDYTYDIYAQWPLEQAEFDQEVARVKKVFDLHATEFSRNYVVLQKGNYTCLIAYEGNPPFEQVTDSYTYYIFAYSETNLTVRYILCDSLENGADQPYYLSLEW